MAVGYADTFHEWASLGADLRWRPSGLSICSSFAGLIESARALREAEFRELRDLLKWSQERLEPLGEPLSQDIGLNRWLARAREEAYSDWLKWLFEQMNAGELFKALSLREFYPEDQTRVQEPVRVVRELIVKEGHEGQQGRIDLVLQLGQWGVVVLEVKRNDADSADTRKQLGYENSIENDPAFRDMRKSYVMLATSSSRDVVDSFDVRRYAVFCRNLRRLAIKWMHSKPPRLFVAAVTLIVAATIEGNLLRLSAQKGSFTPSTLNHLKAFAEEDDYE
jgi:hypothetical protein